MAKRFTDTDKWRDEWWGSLSNDYRMIWLYLVDSCSPAGIWKKDFRGMSFNCNVQVTEEMIKETFSSRLIDRNNFFFILKFLRFQYPKGLNSNKPAIVSVRRELALNNLSIIVNQSFGNDYLIVKDMDKDKDMVKDKDKEQNKDNSEFEFEFKSAFDELTLEGFEMHYKHKGLDIPAELKSFRLKCDNDKATYYHRSSGTLRTNFQYQLDHARTNGKQITTSKQAEIRNKIDNA